ncbi:MAG TPA: hypothetical protein VHA14_18280 [Bryobacteraceae bacterium]|nr:hypothetical protein [Bryobacteraceae bacterium]
MDPRWRIPRPCHKKWGELSGEGRERFCEDCQSAVYPEPIFDEPLPQKKYRTLPR